MFVTTRHSESWFIFRAPLHSGQKVQPLLGPNRSESLWKVSCDLDYHNGWCVSWLGSLPSFPLSLSQFLFGDKNMSSMTFWFILKSSYQRLFLFLSSLWFISPPTKKSWERTCQCEMEYFLRLPRCGVLTKCEFQFDCEHLLSNKRESGTKSVIR